MKTKKLKKEERLELLEELTHRYDSSKSFKQRLIYYRKKYSWIFVVDSTKVLKRLADIFFSFFGLIILSPLFFIIALLIKLQDGGPIFYVQKRVGRWGREFNFPKFRTMILGAEKRQEELIAATKHRAKGKSFKMKDDPRITFIGRILRKTSLDELPQLWCVLKGEMSLVGPRPPLPSEVRLYTMEERKRLDITPGLTCIWQVSGRSDIPFDKQVKMDLEYIESQSLWLDFKILLRTIPAIFFGKGAY